MENINTKLIKQDISEDGSIKIETHESFDQVMKYITFKNNKAIGWSSNLDGALSNHEMFVSVQIRKEENSEAVLRALKQELLEKGRNKNNGYLHDFI